MMHMDAAATRGVPNGESLRMGEAGAVRALRLAGGAWSDPSVNPSAFRCTGFLADITFAIVRLGIRNVNPRNEHQRTSQPDR